MLCYAMLCYAMLMLCYVMLCYVMLCYGMYVCMYVQRERESTPIHLQNLAKFGHLQKQKTCSNQDL